MLIAALLVPATTWWVNQKRRQAESALATENKPEQQPFTDSKSKRETPTRRLDAGSVEFSPVQVMRTSWNGQTDPDSVWHDQRRRANSVLVQHGLPALDTGYGALPPHRIPAR
jgi:hypothetical protein